MFDFASAIANESPIVTALTIRIAITHKRSLTASSHKQGLPYFSAADETAYKTTPCAGTVTATARTVPRSLLSHTSRRLKLCLSNPSSFHEYCTLEVRSVKLKTATYCTSPDVERETQTAALSLV